MTMGHVLLALVAPFVVLTALGSHRRGNGAAAALLAGLVFPADLGGLVRP